MLWLLLVSTVFAAGEGLLWRVSGNGADGYLFGTMHSEDPRVTTLPVEVEHHFSTARTLVLEVSLDRQSEAAARCRGPLYG